MPRPLLTTLTLTLGLAGAAAAGTLHPALSDQLAAGTDATMHSVIAYMAERADIPTLNRELHARQATRIDRHREVVLALQQAGLNQSGVLTRLDELKTSGKVEGFTRYWITNAVVFLGNAEAVREIAARADVETVQPNFTVSLVRPVGDFGHGSAAPQGIGVTPGLKALHADRVWRELGITGAGRIVANLDTGVDGNHPALASRWRGVNGGTPAEAWLDVLGGGTSFPSDGFGHGTHVMGTLTGLGAATGDTVGVAWGATWIACNAINQGVGSGFDNDVLTAYEWFADPDDDPFSVDDVPDVVQNSWRINEQFGSGYTDCDSRWWAAIDNCEAAGVVTTWSAGNEGPGATTIGSPADRATTPVNAFSVGAVDATHFDFPYPIASFSSRGPSGCDDVSIKPEVAAPGVQVYSSVPGGGYQEFGWDGTSMAGPHAAGIVALMREANPNLDVDTIKQILMDTARDEGTAGEDNSYGHGFVDAYEAVIQAAGGSITGTVSHASTGVVVYNANVSVVEAGRSFTTGLDGVYDGIVPAGTYTVTATHPAFINGSATGVGVPESGSTVQNFSLTPRPADPFPPTILSVSQPCGTDDAIGPYLISARITDNLAFVDARLNYRVNGGSVSQVMMTHTAVTTYTGQIPGQPFGSTIEFYIEAHDAKGNGAFDPPSAPADWRTMFVEAPTLVFNDDVEADRGWTLGVAGDTAVRGVWERGNPQGTTDGGQPAQPEDDHTPGAGVNCFATQLQAGSGAGSFDVDSGCTTLLSPPFSLAASADGRISYWRWFYDNPTDDELIVSISSNDGSTWTPIETVAITANTWTRVSISLCGIVPLTNQMRLRFVICDDSPASTCEAAVDDVRIDRFQGDVVGVADNTVFTGPRTALEAVNPNPFNPTTHVTYSLAERGEVALRVFDINGREVSVLAQGLQSPGRYTLTWNGTDAGGKELSTGVYFLRLEANGQTFNKQVTLLK